MRRVYFGCSARAIVTGSWHTQLAGISVQSDTMINGLKQAVSKDGGELGTPKLLVRSGRCDARVLGLAVPNA